MEGDKIRFCVRFELYADEGCIFLCKYSQEIHQRRLVWRRAMMATLPELERRGVDHGYNWKDSNVDPGLAIPYPPFWAARSTEELIDFYNFLIRSKPTKS